MLERKRGSVQALDTVVTSSGAHPATIVEVPPQVEPEPKAPEAQPAIVAAETPKPRRPSRREVEEEPKSSSAGRLALVALAIVAVAAGVLGYRKFMTPAGDGQPSEVTGAPSTLPPGETGGNTQTKPASQSKPAQQSSTSSFPPPPPPQAIETPKPVTEGKVTAPSEVTQAAPLKERAVKPVPTPTTQTHVVQVRSNPPGASVVADKDAALSCTTPCELTLQDGRHVLMMTMAGHRLLPRIIQVPQDSDVTVNLETMSGTLAVSSKPPGATITLNGEKRNEKTPAMIKLPVGKYKIVLTLEGQQPFEDEVVVRDQVMTNIGVDW